MGEGCICLFGVGLRFVATPELVVCRFILLEIERDETPSRITQRR